MFKQVIATMLYLVSTLWCVNICNAESVAPKFSYSKLTSNLENTISNFVLYKKHPNESTNVYNMGLSVKDGYTQTLIDAEDSVYFESCYDTYVKMTPTQLKDTSKCIQTDIPTKLLNAKAYASFKKDLSKIFKLVQTCYKDSLSGKSVDSNICKVNTSTGGGYGKNYIYSETITSTSSINNPNYTASGLKLDYFESDSLIYPMSKDK